MKRTRLAELIDDAELSRLFAEYGPRQRHQVVLDVSSTSFDGWIGRMVHHPKRRGEVVLAIQRPDSQILLHTKRFYPKGIFRLPSGGVHPNEAVLQAVRREAKEETGLDVTLKHFLGTVEYKFCHNQGELPYISYVFLVQASKNRPEVQDSGEEITGFRYVSLPGIRQAAEALRALPAEWADWGQFRAPAHDLLADTLES